MRAPASFFAASAPQLQQIGLCARRQQTALLHRKCQPFLARQPSGVRSHARDAISLFVLPGGAKHRRGGWRGSPFSRRAFVCARALPKPVHEQASRASKSGRRSAERRSRSLSAPRQQASPLDLGWSRPRAQKSGALAFRRSTAALAKASRPWLSPVPRFMGSGRVSPSITPGSELLADRRRGRPGGFPNRPRRDYEPRRGHRIPLRFRDRLEKRPFR